MKIILGIETSCDDTSMAIIRGRPDELHLPPAILAHQSFSQEKLLQEWGGVVPEIAARNHMQKIIPLLKSAMKEADVQFTDIDLIGVTMYPGLLGPLLTGLNVAKTLSLALKTPLYPVNHLYAHLEAIHLTESIDYPYLGLLVSGGHSIYFWVTGPAQFEVLGTTIDDAAGEAFDKGGRLLGLPYPSGKIIDDIAKSGNPLRYEFPIGLKNKKEPLLSYSGLKTSLKYFLDQHPEIRDAKESDPDVVASYQHAIVEALRLKLLKAKKMLKAEAKEGFHNKTPLVIGGGVAANSYLRKVFNEHFKNVHFVAPQFCTDNGAMIANLALRNFAQKIPYPESLQQDARSSFLNKDQLQGLNC